MADEKTLKATVQWGQKGAEDVKKGAKDVEKTLVDTGKKMTDMGLRMGAASAAILGPATLAANSYIKAAGQGEDASRRWLASSRQLEESQIRIGRSVATSLLPVMERAAILAERAASFVEKNPKALDATLALGSSLGVAATLAAVGGQVVWGASQISKALPSGVGIGPVGGLIVAGGTQFTAEQIARNQLKGVAGSGIPGVVAGMALQGNLALGGPGAWVGQQIGTAIGNALMSIPAFKQTATQLLSYVGVGPGVNIPPPVTNWQNMASADQMRSTQLSFDIQAGEAEQEHERQRTQIVREQGLARTEAERQYEYQRTLTVRDQGRARMEAAQDFQRQVAESEYQYYRQRSLAARDFNISVQRMEEDRQLSVKRSQEDHRLRLLQLARSGDASGWLDEMRSYELQRRRSEEDYNIQAKRRNEDYGRQRQDAEANYQHQRDLAQKNFDIMDQRTAAHNEQALKDLDTQFGLQQGVVARQNAEALRTFEADFAAQKAAQQRALDWALYNLGAFPEKYAGIMTATNTSLDASMKHAEGTIDSYLAHYGLSPLGESLYSTPKLPMILKGYASGGYVENGLYRAGENGREFMLNATTTRELETRGGGRLTQSGVLSLAGSGDVHVHFHGDVPAGVSPRVIEAQVNAALASKFGRVTRRVAR
jgi:hypothetical protein